MENYFAENRKKLFEKMKDNSCLILCSGFEKHKSGDENYPFCVNKNFYYLAGLEKPGIYLVMTKTDGKCETKIFVPYMAKTVWTTPGYTVVNASVISDADEVGCYDKIFNFKYNENLALYTDFKHTEFYDNFEYKNNCEDCYAMIVKLRAVKSDYEIKQIEKAINITLKGLLEVFSHISNCEYEYQVQGIFEGAIKFNNSQDLAFATICANGKNACTLHYSDNTDKLEQGSLLLLNLGAKYNHFSSDISRTIPCSTKFDERQKKYYSIVLKGQKMAIKMAKPGVSIIDINNALIDYYFAELKREKLITTKDEVKKYYMHSIGHSLGLDTHDEGLLRSEKLVPGNVITIEPGLYIPQFKIGIRIEDDVLITEDGNRVLSKKIPKTIKDIEEILK